MTLEVTLEGRHVRLEPLRRDHADLLVAAATEPGADYRYTSVPTDPAATAAYVDAAHADADAGLALVFVIVELAGGRVVGSTRFLDLAYWADHPPSASPGPSAVEIGATWLAVSAQRTPLNTETKLLMLGHAFDSWGVHRVTFKTDARNTQSRRAIERIGATYEGVHRRHVPAVDGTIRDSAYYSIVDSEWPDVRDQLRRLLARGHRAGHDEGWR